MKIIPIPLSFGLTDTIYETKMGFKTADVNSAVLQFTSDSDPVGCVATLSMKNETDNSNRFSLVLEQMDVSANPFSYILGDEIGSSGVWIGEITLKKDLVTVCSQEFRFAIGESLQTSIMDVLIQAKSVDEMMVAIQEDVTEHLGKSDESVKQITAYVNGVVAKLLANDNTRTLQERDRVLAELARETDYDSWVLAVQTLIDTAVIDNRVKAIIDEYQSTYAQLSLSVTQQLAEAKTDMDNFHTEIASEVTTAKEDLNAIVDNYQVTVNQQLAEVENTKAEQSALLVEKARIDSLKADFDAIGEMTTGTNANGTYTRWPNGFTIARKTITYNASGGWPTGSNKTFNVGTMPITFTDDPTIIVEASLYDGASSFDGFKLNVSKIYPRLGTIFVEKGATSAKDIVVQFTMIGMS